MTHYYRAYFYFFRTIHNSTKTRFGTNLVHLISKFRNKYIIPFPVSEKAERKQRIMRALQEKNILCMAEKYLLQ